MNLDPGYLLASMFVSGIGFVLFRFGRSRDRFPFTVVGVLMLVYPYLVTDVVLMLLIAAAILLLLWVATRMGL